MGKVWNMQHSLLSGMRRGILEATSSFLSSTKIRAVEM